jgi:hypothetical protein
MYASFENSRTMIALFEQYRRLEWSDDKRWPVAASRFELKIKAIVYRGRAQNVYT